MKQQTVPLDTAIEQLTEACRTHLGDQASPELVTVVDRFFRAAEDDPTLWEKASRAMTTLAPSGAAWMAGAIARGVELELTLPAVWDLFLSWLPLASVPSEIDTLEAEVELSAEFEAALPILCQSIVSHLAGAPVRRLELANDAQLMDRLAQLESLSDGICWVVQALRRSSDTLVLLHPTSGKGLRVRYENVSTCFHLFTLLQLSIGPRLPGGRTPNRTVTKVVSGALERYVDDSAWWHYGDPCSNTPDFESSIWGEMLVRHIPRINGTQLLLLWPTLLAGRSWSSGFFGPHLEALPARLSIENELNSDEIKLLVFSGWH